jgi:hypothetical protein
LKFKFSGVQVPKVRCTLSALASASLGAAVPVGTRMECAARAARRTPLRRHDAASKGAQHPSQPEWAAQAGARMLGPAAASGLPCGLVQ